MLFLFSSRSVIQEYWEEAIMSAMPKIQTKNGIATMTVVVRLVNISSQLLLSIHVHIKLH